ncbi:ATP-binding protein [Azospirillum sp. TSO35-2]|uniref:NACHT domain-containing protein n=1 Tax=Azospirillum sp. TSO35-2 TaxID=716796 RepID=UPI0011B572B9|nr:ATP-binding protein [Azospirillum sp. TSO35-2]
MQGDAGGRSKRRQAGGAATGGGMNFQAATTAIANVYMARGRPLLWLNGLVDDTPIAVDAETGGAGDDIRLLLKDTRTVEVQAKKGLQKGLELWEALLKISAAVSRGAADFGVLLVSPTSSRTITHSLAVDIVRIGDGRTDDLSSIAVEFLDKLAAACINAQDACARLRIQTVPALAVDQAAVLAARAELAHLCADETQIGGAWNALYTDAAKLIEHRGRRDVAAVLRLLVAEQIMLSTSTGSAPALLLAKLSHWTLTTHATFTIFGINTPLSINDAWIPLTATVRDEPEVDAASLEDALHRYQSWETRSAPRDARSVDPETLGRFVTKTVLVAGPGMGKTTLLKRIARRYSEDNIPLLRVRLSAVAARMRDGATFEEAVFHLGLGGSGITVADAQNARFPNWTLLCDGLDECGRLQEEVAEGVACFAAGHPDSRILVTTRPIGYRAAHFREWRHYDLPALDTLAVCANAAGLIEAIAPLDSELHVNAWDICQREFHDKIPATIVGRTPLLLGLSVAIIVRGKNLGTTRERLFEQIFELIDEAPNMRIPEPPAPATLLRRFLDILGWHITGQPLDSIWNTLKRCADDLANDTGARPFAAAADAERYLRYWQDVGMIERVGLGERQTLAFIHKSFGEFAAARYQRALSPIDQAQAVTSTLDAPAWNEVIRLTGLMGMADVIVSQLLIRSDEATDAKRMVLAAELMAEATPPPNPELRGKIIDQSFAIITGNRRQQAFNIGMPLVTAAKRFPDEVGPTAARHLGSENPWTRLIAWACSVAAGPEHYDLDELIATLRESVETLEPGFRQSLSGGMMLAGDAGRHIAESLVFDACGEIIDRAPAEVGDSLLPEILNHDNLGSLKFRTKVTELVRRKGRHYPVHGPEWSGRSLFDDRRYFEARKFKYNAIFDALDLDTAPAPCDDQRPRVLLHMSAFIEASQLNNIPVSDVWVWTRPYDRDATRAVLRGLIAVSGLDRDKLREEAVYAKRYLDTEAAANEDSFLFKITTQVDPPPVDWKRAKALGLDAGLIEAAVAHPSEWIKWAATNLLLAMLDPKALEDTARRLLDTGKALTLWAACGLAAELDRNCALALVLDRLAKPLVPGCRHLFDLLRTLNPAWSPELETAVYAGLFATDVNTATATATLLADMAGSALPQLVPLLEQAHAHWVVHEEPYPTKGGVIPTSPRAKIIEALHKIRPALYQEIKGYLADPRSEIRDFGAVTLAKRLQQPAGERLQFLSEIGKGELSSYVLSKVLREGIPLNPIELSSAEKLLLSERGSVRYSAMTLLTDQYLDCDRIRIHASALTRDNEQEIRDRAYAILDKH